MTVLVRRQEPKSRASTTSWADLPNKTFCL